MSQAVHRRIHPIAAWALILTALAIWIVGVWSQWHDWIPAWALVALAPALLAFTLFAYRRLSRPDLLDDDPLKPWRSLRAVKRVVLAANDTHDCRLQIELTPEWDLAGPSVTLEFRNVSRLTVQQFDDLVLHFDCLVCCPITTKRDGAIYQVQDRWGEAVGFRCRSFEEIARTGKLTEPSGTAREAQR